jgi:preprotein translocase subunit SecA
VPASLFSQPPATASLRPEKKGRRVSALDDATRAITAPLMRFLRSRCRPGNILPLVEKHGAGASSLSDGALRQEAARLGLLMRKEGFLDEIVGHLFALIREAATRAIGQRHFNAQLMGGFALLRGMAVEMETGEGKTLAATLPASAAALAGIPVHVICVNDYLTSRDAEIMGPVYKALGLTVGCVVHEVPPRERQAAYRCHITYCNNKEIAFDYLRDKLTLGEMTNALRLQAEYLYSDNMREDRLLLRGLHFAICDEADSLLIDEARTPLIISGSGLGKEEEEFQTQALALARTLEEGSDYSIDSDMNTIDLKEDGIRRIREASLSLGPLWAGTIRRDDIMRKALAALHLFKPDIHYLVREGKVQIVDEYTGRLMPDRSWERGIHQLIEIKEECEITRQHEPLARITYQRFFRRYLHLCGMTGTAWEVRKELWSVYNLPVVRIPTEKPLRRVRLPDTILPTKAEKERAIRERVEGLHRDGRPVLVGTRSVAASEDLSGLFTEAGLDHKVLNAKNEREEAAIVAGAGQYGSVTVATNMAGRGTDIKLGEGVAELDGLHVILTERHEAARIDRQLAGRCARQGDPGSYEAILSLEDSLLEDKRAAPLRWVAGHLFHTGSSLWTAVSKIAILYAQRRMDRVHARARRELLKQDEKMGTVLSFSGLGE